MTIKGTSNLRTNMTLFTNADNNYYYTISGANFISANSGKFIVIKPTANDFTLTPIKIEPQLSGSSVVKINDKVTITLSVNGPYAPSNIKWYKRPLTSSNWSYISSNDGQMSYLFFGDQSSELKCTLTVNGYNYTLTKEIFVKNKGPIIFYPRAQEHNNLTLSNSPNPFNPTTTIRFSLPLRAGVQLEIINSLGQRVKTLISNQVMDAGKLHSITWDATNNHGQKVSSGLYFYRLVSGNQFLIKKMILMK